MLYVIIRRIDSKPAITLSSQRCCKSNVPSSAMQAVRFLPTT